ATLPVYIYIKDDQVEIRDAEHLWGLEIMDTEDTLKAEVGERLARVCEIGPSGEKCVKIAGIVNDYKDIAGRAGLGAVMGWKKLVKLEQPYQIDPKYGGPEFESIAAMGSDCGIGDLAVVAKANERCNALGVDTISFGATVAWAMDLQRRGILANAEVDGVPLAVGSG